MDIATVYPKHRFYFTIEAESNRQVIADGLPSYHIVCKCIKQHAKATGNEQEAYYIRLYRRHNRKCWSVLRCRVRFRDDTVLIVGARHIEHSYAA